MTECEEVAEALHVNLNSIITFSDALAITRSAMGEETNQVISNVAHALFAMAVRHATGNAIRAP
jgi:hypothetical protein